MIYNVCLVDLIIRNGNTWMKSNTYILDFSWCAFNKVLMKRYSPWCLCLPLSSLFVPLFGGLLGLLLFPRRGFPLQCFARFSGQLCSKSWLCFWLLKAMTILVLVSWFVAGCDSSCSCQGKISVVFGFFLSWALRPSYVNSCTIVSRLVWQLNVYLLSGSSQWLSSISDTHN